MANHKSAEKRMRQNIKRRERNRTVRSEVKTETKKMRQAIVQKENIESQMRETCKTINKAATKGVLKKKTASRRISRLARQAQAAISAPAKE